ncbi:hypothetical protein JX265_012101 [Neoarthrinium moseri]|uniref:Uncharacterized protein n=1 Tax=Neoarthrinium moseri TaxID=1658444 RepID=A0A9P9WBB3_9PEZI|nr:uncharacterized protein JN550_001345 [Neoarthrinium moseri]KAI1849338.1 hypothetical protein JX266_004833 [Neoarthrinium moseri]KAI1855838.1 hypothetical protein JX265_012101 [Neoarthrinium moseri]KAI1877273.1 hypothetical protein JN550_001345 [Neoarthrinium moseri]
MSARPTHTQDAKHSSAMLDMFADVDRLSPYTTTSKKSSSSSAKYGDNASLFSTSSYSSTRSLLKSKPSSSRSGSKTTDPKELYATAVRNSLRLNV